MLLVEIAALLPWPDSDAVTACVWIGFGAERRSLLLHTGTSPWSALTGIFQQAILYSRMTAAARN